MKKFSILLLVLAMICMIFAGCGGTSEDTDSEADTSDKETEGAPVKELEVEQAEDDLLIGFCFVDLETEFWVAAYDAVTHTLKSQGIDVIEYNASEDPIKQQQMCQSALAEGVDGMIIIPQNGDVADAIAKDYNEAGVPLGVFNRPPADQNTKALVVAADNEAISEKAMEHMADEARKKFETTGEKILPICMTGDLGDPNAIARKQGFLNVYEANRDLFEEYVEVMTEWDAKVALDNLTTAVKANPDVGLIFCGSDFMYPQIQQVLEANGKWVKAGEENHVILGAVDGDATAGRLMDEGYVDATAVQDLYYEAEVLLDAMIKAINAGEKTPSEWIDDPGFALTQANMNEKRMDMWGNKVRQSKGEID